MRTTCLLYMPTQDSEFAKKRGEIRLGHEIGENISMWIYGRDFEKSQLFYKNKVDSMGSDENANATRPRVRAVL